MPIEIRELVVKARVEPSGDRSGAASTRSPAGTRMDETSIIRACVKEVLRILESRQER